MKKAYENCWETFETRFSGFMRLFKIHECFYSNVRGGGNCEAISDGAGVSL
jgi:hypothetical protein